MPSFVLFFSIRKLFSSWPEFLQFSPPTKEPVLRRSEDTTDGDILEGFLCSECKAMFEDPDSLQQHYSACHLDDNELLHNFNSSYDIKDPTLQAQQEYIDALLPVVGR